MMNKRSASDMMQDNEPCEIETYDEFIEKIKGLNPNEVHLQGWTFQSVDLSSIPLEDFNQYDVHGAGFWGCVFPQGVRLCDIREKGALVQEEPTGIPFKCFRAFMYRQEELQPVDEEIYRFMLSNRSIKAEVAKSMHDFFIFDALYDYLEGKSVVVIMGGHALLRASKDYRDVVYLGYRLAKLGFVVATGGGPGAMEAANLGAYMFEKSEAEVEEALKILSTVKDSGKVYHHEFENKEAPKAVIERFKSPTETESPSLGIATWYYGHEPPNYFATWHAKMFSNAVREDCLVSIGTCGIVYFPGSAGTRQEVFQAACKNHYSDGVNTFPMIFVNQTFWNDSGVFETLVRNSEGRPFKKWLLCTDNENEVVDQCVKYRTEYNLPIVTKEILLSKFWEKGTPTISKRKKKFLDNIIITENKSNNEKGGGEGQILSIN